jgi:hypothetical protein
MSTNKYAEDLWSKLDSAWDLCVAANAYPENIRSDFSKIWSELFCNSKIIVVDHASLDKHKDRLEVICTDPYGICFNDKIKKWVPFRHGEKDLNKF